MGRCHRLKAKRLQEKAAKLTSTDRLAAEIGFRVAERAVQTAERYERKNQRSARPN